MKIAVCFHGEPRTWHRCVPNIKHFLGNGTYNIKFFGHTWLKNSWKKFDQDNIQYYEYEDLDKKLLYNGLMSAYNFSDLQIDPPYVVPFEKNTRELPFPDDYIETSQECAANFKMPWVWNSMSYSAMLSNFLKQKYEVENNMRFDLVLRMRYDACFDPHKPFVNYLPSVPQIRENVLFSEVSYFPFEYMQQTVNDVFYFGNSRTMDIIESFYRIYHNGDFFRLLGAHYFDGAIKNCGYGVLIYKWATLKNIYPENIKQIYWSVLRQDSKCHDVINDYQQLVHELKTWGMPK